MRFLAPVARALVSLGLCAVVLIAWFGWYAPLSAHPETFIVSALLVMPVALFLRFRTTRLEDALRKTSPDPRNFIPRGAVVVFVHGTGEGYKPSGSPQWWERGGSFYNAVERLFPNNDKLEIETFAWSGENSEVARETAAEDLRGRFREIRKDERQSFVVAYSHGANVVRLATQGLEAEETPYCVIAVGAPFFTYNWTSRLTRLAGAIGGVALIAIAGITLWLASGSPTLSIDWSVGAWLILSCAVVALVLMLFVVSGVGVSRRFTNAALRWRLCSTELDEALLGLGWVARPTFLDVSLEQFLKRFEGRRSWRVQALAFLCLWILLWALCTTALQLEALDEVPSWTAMAVSAPLALLLSTPIQLRLACAFNVARFFAMKLLEVGAGAFLRGLSYGDDLNTGISGVSDAPGIGEVSHIAIPADCLLELEREIQSGIGELWLKMRTDLRSNIGTRTATLSSIVQGSITWAELAHTLYFKIPCIQSVIADALRDEVNASLALDPVQRVRRLEAMRDQQRYGPV